MFDSPHTSVPMLMRGNALVLKTPVENAPRTSIEKHLSWSSDIPPASIFPLHRSSPAEYQPNQQPVTVCAESRAGVWRGTTTSRTTTRAANEWSPQSRALVKKSSAPSPGSQSTCHSAMGYRGQHLTVQVTYTAENQHADGSGRPEHVHATDRPDTVIGWWQDRRPVVSKRPLHSIAAAKMSPPIRIGPEPVLATHDRPPPATGSHSLDGANSQHSEQNFKRFCSVIGTQCGFGWTVSAAVGGAERGGSGRAPSWCGCTVESLVWSRCWRTGF